MQQNSLQKPKIDQYFDYREYLADLFTWHKECNPVFSHRYIVQKAGFKSPTVLKDVIDKKKNLTPSSIEKFALAFKLSDYEKEYLTVLLRFNTAETLSEKDKFFNEVTLLRKRNSGRKIQEEDFDILEKWWTLAIRELISLPDYKHSTKWLARALEPEVSIADVQHSLSVLEKTGMIKKVNGQWVAVDKTIKTDREVRSVVVAKYHAQMLDLAKDAMYKIPSDKREISGTTLRIPLTELPRIKDMLYEIRQTILHVAEKSTDPDQVYQLNFQLFPLVKTERGDRLGSPTINED